MITTVIDEKRHINLRLPREGFPNIMYQEAVEAANFLKEVFGPIDAQFGIVLGSGLGEFIKEVEVIASIPYAEIPFFPVGHIKGHKERLSLVRLEDKLMLVMEGRFHYYEGFSLSQVTFPIVVFHFLGVKNLIVSNAAGSCNLEFKPGDLMIIRDHINFMGASPLFGSNNDSIGPRFLDLTDPYSNILSELAKITALELGIHIHEGTYLAVSGPTYETKAEIKAFRVLGADAVGMSTVPEVIIANYFGMEVLGVSCITNMGTGLTTVKHSHAEVVAIANAVSHKFSLLIKNVIMRMLLL